LDNPSECYDYHEVYREARKNWEVIPYEEAIKWCKERSNYVIGDFGCGEAFLAAELVNKVHSFDHVAMNDSVIACDMVKVPLDGTSLDVVVFSLSLMGTNFVDYLREARRCLKLDGHLWIAEPTSRIKDEDLFKELLERIGFYVLCVKKKGKFTFIEALKSGREINEAMVKVLMGQQLLL
jgi:SAM-dependent methyltransferase